MVTSRYHRTRTNLRGIGGSVETYYDVQSWGNGRGGIDAEWERFHDAWKESFLQGGYYNQGPGYGNGYPGQFGNGGYGGPGYGYPGYGFPGAGFPGGGFYGGPGNVVIDTCERCLVNWLDPGELRRIAIAPDS